MVLSWQDVYKRQVISIPMVAGGNIKRMEDVQRILYSGAKRVILNFSKPDSAETVSYTHLDVYKRQIKRHQSFSEESRRVFEDWHIMIIGPIN